MQTQTLSYTQEFNTETIQRPALLTKQERHELLLKILKTSQKKPNFFKRLKMSLSTKAQWKPTKNTGKSGISFNQM